MSEIVSRDSNKICENLRNLRITFLTGDTGLFVLLLFLVSVFSECSVAYVRGSEKTVSSVKSVSENNCVYSCA